MLGRSPLFAVRSGGGGATRNESHAEQSNSRDGVILEQEVAGHKKVPDAKQRNTSIITTGRRCHYNCCDVDVGFWSSLALLFEEQWQNIFETVGFLQAKMNLKHTHTFSIFISHVSSAPRTSLKRRYFDETLTLQMCLFVGTETRTFHLNVYPVN